MANFSFAPEPSMGWGNRSTMGRALWDAMTRGLGLSKMYEDQSFNSALQDMRLHNLPMAGYDDYWHLRNQAYANQGAALRNEDAIASGLGTGFFGNSNPYTPNGMGLTRGIIPNQNLPTYSTPYGGFTPDNPANINSMMYNPSSSQMGQMPHPQDQYSYQNRVADSFMNGSPLPNTMNQDVWSQGWQPRGNNNNVFPMNYFRLPQNGWGY